MKTEYKMKKIVTLALLLIVGANARLSAQDSMIGDVNSAILAKYIQAAKENYPRKKIYEQNIDKAKSGVSMSQLSYLDILNASYFYRPNDRASLNPTNPYTVNGFQFGATLNLGTFLQKPAMAKRAKADLKIAQLENEEYSNVLTNEVRKRYYNYIRLLNDLKIKTQNTQDNVSVVENLKKKYEKGETQLEAYNYSRIRAAEAASSKLQAEADYLMAKDALEEIIGQKLTDIK